MAAFMPAAKPMLAAWPVADSGMPCGAVRRASSRLPSRLPESTSAISAGGGRRAAIAAMQPARSGAESWVTRQMATSAGIAPSPGSGGGWRLPRGVAGGVEGDGAGQPPAGERAGQGHQQAGRRLAAGGGTAGAADGHQRQAEQQAGDQAGSRRRQPGGAVVLGQVALEAAVVDPQEAPVTQAWDAAAKGVAKARRRPVEQARAGLPQAVREVDVLEPGGMEALVEAAGGQERVATERQRRRGRLLDRRAGWRLGGETAGGAGSAGERPGEGLAQAAPGRGEASQLPGELRLDRKSTRLNSSHPS